MTITTIQHVHNNIHYVTVHDITQVILMTLVLLLYMQLTQMLYRVNIYIMHVNSMYI